jgi:hypothetical protein
MANFEPLVSELKAAGGIQIVTTRDELISSLKKIPNDQVASARTVLEKHEGAMIRTITLFS